MTLAEARQLIAETVFQGYDRRPGYWSRGGRHPLAGFVMMESYYGSVFLSVRGERFEFPGGI